MIIIKAFYHLILWTLVALCAVVPIASIFLLTPILRSYMPDLATAVVAMLTGTALIALTLAIWCRLGTVLFGPAPEIVNNTRYEENHTYYLIDTDVGEMT